MLVETNHLSERVILFISCLILNNFKYHLMVDQFAYTKKGTESSFVNPCCYGQLHSIPVCMLPGHTYFAKCHRHQLFALVQSCETDEKDETLDPVTSTKMQECTQIIELSVISCAISCVKVGAGKEWGIIDRTKGMVHTVFVDDPELFERTEDGIEYRE